MKVGDIFDDEAAMGSVISATQLERISGFVERAKGYGATINIGGEVIDQPGSWYSPTVVTDIAQDSEIIQNEVFGPVVTVQQFTDEDTRSRGPTVSTTAWPPRCGPATWAARCGCRASCSSARCGSIRTSRSRPRCRTAGTSRAGTARTCPIYSIEEYTNVKHVMASLD
jgi:betaine-aldehyde dehydrogenase